MYVEYFIIYNLLSVSTFAAMLARLPLPVPSTPQWQPLVEPGPMPPAAVIIPVAESNLKASLTNHITPLKMNGWNLKFHPVQKGDFQNRKKKNKPPSVFEFQKSEFSQLILYLCWVGYFIVLDGSMTLAACDHSSMEFQMRDPPRNPNGFCWRDDSIQTSWFDNCMLKRFLLRCFFLLK